MVQWQCVWHWNGLDPSEDEGFLTAIKTLARLRSEGKQSSVVDLRHVEVP